MSNKLVTSNEYLSFRSAVPLKQIIVDDNDSKVWKLYDAGPRTVKCPIVCLPPASGRADMFFRQVLGLSASGYRVISLDYPVYWSVEDFCIGLRKIIDYLHLDQIHIFGCSLGGYLALKFAERMRNTSYVASMVLCNAFTDTSVFKFTRASSAFWIVPAFVLKRLVMSSYTSSIVDAPQADATDFVVDCLENLSQQEIASRLSLHCNGEYVRQPHELQHIPVTIIDVFDDCALSQTVKDDMYKCFPNARKAHLKTGGNFPYLSRASEVNLHIRIHLKPFEETKSNAQESATGASAQVHSKDEMQTSANAQTNRQKQQSEASSIMRTSSCGSVDSENELQSRSEDNQNPATLLEISQMQKPDNMTDDVPTIEVDDGMDAIDFPI